MTNLAQHLAAIRARAENATKGPWQVGGSTPAPRHRADVQTAWLSGPVLFKSGKRAGQVRRAPSAYPVASDLLGFGAMYREDAEFCAHARTDIPRLLAALKIACDFVDGVSRVSLDAELRNIRENAQQALADAERALGK